jgi:hypothetical protein
MAQIDDFEAGCHHHVDDRVCIEPGPNGNPLPLRSDSAGEAKDGAVLHRLHEEEVATEPEHPTGFG